MKRGGQATISFGMVFSIIMIIIFISFAFYAIQKFLDLQNSAQVGKFGSDFQADIDKMWKSSQGSQKYEYILPAKIKYACFGDFGSEKKGANQNLYDSLRQAFYGSENFFFYPVGSAQGLNSKIVKNIDLAKIAENENPFCIENKNGKLSVTIKKGFGEALVTTGR